MNEDKKTRKAPAFQFYADDFLAGTITMTNEERGAYIALLCIQWSKESLTENDFQRVCGGMPPHSQRICQSKFQIDAEGNYKNQRLETEREKQVQYRKKQTDNANKRWLGNATAYATALPADMPNACSPSPSPSPNNKEESIALKSQRSTFVVPSVEEVESECARIGLSVSEASKFANYYESKGWIVGKTKMKSWKSALIGWKNRQIEFQQQRDRQQSLSIAAHSKTVLSTNVADYQ
jgi:uncharacterized protein YdaU (DUF1376 family)